MRASEVLRNTRRSQGFGAMRSGDAAFCALGVLYDAIGVRLLVGAVNVPSEILLVLYSEFPELLSPATGRALGRKCPVSGCYSKEDLPGLEGIVHLNDGHKLSFSQIADWLDTLAG